MYHPSSLCFFHYRSILVYYSFLRATYSCPPVPSLPVHDYGASIISSWFRSIHSNACLVSISYSHFHCRLGRVASDPEASFFFQHVGHGGWSGLLRRLTTRGLIQRFSIYPSSCQLVICQHFDVLLASVNVFNIRTFRSETVSQHTGVQVHSKVPFSLLGSQHAAVLHTPDCQDRRRARRPGVQISKPHAHRFGE